MNVSTWGGCFFSSLLLLGCSNINPQVHSPQAARSSLPHSPVEVPFELRDGSIFVQARVNGSVPEWFKVDTGAAYSEVSEARLSSLKLKPVGRVTLCGIAGKVPRKIYRGVNFDLCGATFASEAVLGEATQPADRRDEGLIGYELFTQFVVELNYQSRTLRLHDPQKYQYQGSGEAIPVKCERQQVVIAAWLAGLGQQPAEARLVVDTGCGSTLCLARQYVQAHKLQQAAGKTEPSARAGVGGKTSTRIGRLASLEIGGFELQRPVANFFQQSVPAFNSSASPTNLAGHIGAETLRRFTTIFDVPHQRIVFETNAAFAEPFLPEVTVPVLIGVGRKCALVLNGAVLTSEGPAFREFQVGSVIPDSPAADAGIQVNDIVKAVDGEDLASMSAAKLLALARQDNRSHLFTLRRGTQDLEVQVRSSYPF